MICAPTVKHRALTNYPPYPDGQHPLEDPRVSVELEALRDEKIAIEKASAIALKELRDDFVKSICMYVSLFCTRHIAIPTYTDPRSMQAEHLSEMAAFRLCYNSLEHAHCTLSQSLVATKRGLLFTSVLVFVLSIISLPSLAVRFVLYMAS